jgi:hypothetical protein
MALDQPTRSDTMSAIGDAVPSVAVGDGAGRTSTAAPLRSDPMAATVRVILGGFYDLTVCRAV